jgi:CBS domain-containing protein
MSMTVAEVMTSFPVSLSPEASIHKAAQIMRDDDVGVIPIVDGLGVLVGMVTDRDIVIKAVAAGHGPDTPIDDCMTRSPHTVAKDTTVEQTMLLMAQQQIRRVPVVEFGRLIGIVSLADLTNSQVPDLETGETLQQISTDPSGLRIPIPADLKQ